MKLEDLQSQFTKMPESMKVMVEKEVNKQIKTKRKYAPKRVAAVALVATMAVGTTVFGGSKIANMYSHKVNKYAVKVQTDDTTKATKTENLKIKNVSLKMNYLPEGVVRNSEDGKFNLKGDVNQKAITPTIYKMTEGNDKFKILDTNVLKKEDLKIGDNDGVYVQTTKMNDESYSMDKIMYINFEKQHYVVQLNLGEDISKDEAVKIAEGVQLVESKVADRAVEDYSDSVAQGKLESTDATAEVTSVDKAKVNLAKVGNSFKESGADDENKLLTGKVTDVKIFDNLNILGADKKNYSEVIDSKGNLLQDTIKYYKSGDGENSIDKVVKSRKVNQKFIYATVQYTNNTNKTIRDFCYGANVMYLEDSGDNIELYEETPDKNDKWDFIEKTSAYNFDEMIYWDVKNNGIHNSIAAIKPGETKTVHIGFIVDEDMLKYTVLNFTSEKTDLSDNVISNGLVDIRQ